MPKLDVEEFAELLDALEDLRKSDYVALAMEAERIALGLRARVDELRVLERKGMKLSAAGWTKEALEQIATMERWT